MTRARKQPPERKPLILTAIDNNHPFWYDQLIPFMLSLTDTDYSGCIGVIGYGLTAEKEQVLRDNGVLVFQAAGRFDEITLDRQYTAAQIAQQPEYSQVALYDTDIWFPNPQFTLFEHILNRNKLYAAYDITLNQFVFDCVHKYGIDKLRKQVNQVLAKNGGNPWQVGLIAGRPPAWRRYRDYLDTLITRNRFTVKFGLDTTAFLLYDFDTGNVVHLPERYNCLPQWGLRVHDIRHDGNHPLHGIRNHVFTLNGKPVEGIHVTSNFRRWGRNDYDYAVYHSMRYLNEGKRWRTKAYTFTSVPAEILAKPFEGKTEFADLPVFLVRNLFIENSISTLFDGGDLLIRVTGCSKFELYNPADTPVQFSMAVQEVFDRKQCKETFLQDKNGLFDFKFANFRNHMETLILAPHSGVTFVTYDLDAEYSCSQWRLRGVRLAA